MITSDEVLKYIKVSPDKAEKVTSEINLLAGQYNIDAKKIIGLMQQKPEDLIKQKKILDTERQQLKIDLGKMILPKKE
jgi:hypothetical protein